MIKILNITGSDSNNAKYELSINGKHIAYFEHKRSEGLAECLFKASVAVNRAEYDLINTLKKKVEL